MNTSTEPTVYPAKRIAAIDLGTNSFHGIIVDIYPHCGQAKGDGTIG